MANAKEKRAEEVSDTINKILGNHFVPQASLRYWNVSSDGKLLLTFEYDAGDWEED